MSPVIIAYTHKILFALRGNRVRAGLRVSEIAGLPTHSCWADVYSNMQVDLMGELILLNASTASCNVATEAAVALHDHEITF